MGQVVYQTGFVQPQQVPSVALASAASTATAGALGLAVTDIANGAIGSIRISGNFSPIDTSAFLTNAKAYLSDTFGEIANSPGTVEVIVGQVLTVSLTGCVRIACRIASGECATSGDGSQGATGLQGATGIGSGGGGGSTGLSGTTGIQGATGIGSGGTGLSGVTGIQGVTGIGSGGTGLSGVTGLQGVTGIGSGDTGLQGVTGIGSGGTGLAGVTGITGTTGIAGITGLGADSFTYIEFSCGQTVLGGSGIRFLKVGDVFTSATGYNLFEAITLTGISLRTNISDATNDYDLEILSSPSSSPTVIATLSYPSGTISTSTTVSVAISAGTEIGARMVRTAGAGSSDFSDYIALLKLE